MLIFKIVNTTQFFLSDDLSKKINGFTRSYLVKAKLFNQNIIFQGFESQSGYSVPSSKWAVFEIAANEINSFFKKLEKEFFVESGFTYAGTPYLEIYKTQTDIELWIPVK